MPINKRRLTSADWIEYTGAVKRIRKSAIPTSDTTTGGMVQQTVTTGYGTDGRITSAGFLHQGAEKQFGYSYLPGTNLLQTLTMPCNMTLTQSYETQRDLLTGMTYRRGTTGVAERAYTYDTLGRPLTRRTARKGATVNDTFAYNTRSELTEATVNGAAYCYAYDNIGNRKSAQEAAEEATAYTANALNQYTAIDDFVPTYDADGNQTLVKTSTGVWSVEYNAENRPVTFTRTEGTVATRITCTYDSMGRRATKKVETNGETTLHQRYLYRGYLQIAACDLTSDGTPNLWHIQWDPTQPIATRPLSIQKDGTWFTYGWDLTKNICEVFGSNGYINTIYTYTPYGEVTSSGSTVQPIQWSSEYHDTEFSLVYYNYRHYNPIDGRWLSQDLIADQRGNNPFCFVGNAVSGMYDKLGLLDGGMGAIINGSYGLPPMSVPSFNPRTNPESQEDGQFPIQGTVYLSINDYIHHVNSGSIPLFIEIEKTGELRCDYDKLVQSLKKLNLTHDEATAVRNKIKLEFRSKQTALGKSITNAILDKRKAHGYSMGNFNPYKTNETITATGRVMRASGRVLILFSAGVEIYTIYQSPEENRGKAIAQSGGRFRGGILGGMAAGAALGSSSLNPIGVGVGIICGGIAGSALGEWIVNIICSDEDESDS